MQHTTRIDFIFKLILNQLMVVFAVRELKWLRNYLSFLHLYL
ncbi:hypothetical protein GFPCMMHI_01108 [Ensifer adhaerens]|nr:hypothetical protein [Ensifer adhaerens]